jgi:hypothetical protein
LGIPSDILTARLSSLVEHGILEKQSYRDASNRERFSYHLTESGQGLKLVMAAINQWGEEFNPSPWGPASSFVEVENGEKVGLTFVDDAGNEIEGSNVHWAPGPASTVQW